MTATASRKSMKLTPKAVPAALTVDPTPIHKADVVRVEDVETMAASAAEEFGSLTAVFRNAEKATHTEAGLRAWTEVAYTASLAGVSERKFGTMTGTSNKSLPRLLRLGTILRAFADKGLQVPALMVRPWSDHATADDMTAAVKAIRSGKGAEFLSVPTRKTPKAVTAKESTPEATAEESSTEATAGTPNRETASETVTVGPRQYADVLDVIALRAAEIPDADVQRALDAVTLIADALALRLSGTADN